MNGHGTAPADQQVREGEAASKPADPKASGYTFGGWYADAACSTRYDFSSAIAADTTVYAKWTKNSVTPVGPTDPTNPRTGDSSHLLLWVTLLAAGSAALTGTVIRGRKGKHN